MLSIFPSNPFNWHKTSCTILSSKKISVSIKTIPSPVSRISYFPSQFVFNNYHLTMPKSTFNSRYPYILTKLKFFTIGNPVQAIQASQRFASYTMAIERLFDEKITFRLQRVSLVCPIKTIDYHRDNDRRLYMDACIRARGKNRRGTMADLFDCSYDEAIAFEHAGR